MLCDLMLGKWANPAESPKFEPEVERLIKLSQEGGHEEEIRSTGMSHTRMLQIKATMEKWVYSAVHLSENTGIRLDELNGFCNMLTDAHKFYISPAFALTYLHSFSTPDTLVKAQEWFRLIHDPMWLEWHYDGAPGLRLGALFYTDLLPNGESAYMCYLAEGLTGTKTDPDYKVFEIHHCRLMPETARVSDQGFSMDIVGADGSTIPADEFWMKFALIAYDFIIRLNSPRITDFRPCEDLTRINRKRAKLGRFPLCSYQIVDLNSTIKAQLRQADGEEGGTRFHWRRGHFKARKSGLFWWNPHTAGRKVNGEVEKAYVA